MSNLIKISPSILSADFAKLGNEVKDISEAGADYIHIDVMDGHFVPNITMGPKIVSDIRKYSNVPFDVHLMISDPGKYIEDFANAGADLITIHHEVDYNVPALIRKIKDLGKKAGISIVPSTKSEEIDYILDEIDLVLVMTVNPGFGGQKFMPSGLAKIEDIKNKTQKNGIKIEISVDGGINSDTAKEVINAGADVLVSGSYIFCEDSKLYRNKIDSLRK